MQTTKITVHPVADLFPMLPDDELNTLAADIKTRGQLHPIVLDTENRIIDGRNRFAACQIADIEPQFTTYEGDDADGYALAVNIRRRNISKGQQAMIVASATRLNGDVKKINTRKAAEIYGITYAYFSQANSVLEYAPDEVPRVMAGIQPLNAAYEQAKERKESAAGDENRMTQLRANAPDLADQVAEERLPLKEAWAAYRQRTAEAERQRRVATNLLCEHITTIAQMRDLDTATKYDPDMASPGRAITMQTLNEAQIALEQIIETWKDRGL